MGSILSIDFVGLNMLISSRLKDLFYHHMSPRRIYLASRGFMALNLQMTSTHLDKFVAALEELIEIHKDLMHRSFTVQN